MEKTQHQIQSFLQIPAGKENPIRYDFHHDRLVHLTLGVGPSMVETVTWDFFEKEGLG